MAKLQYNKSSNQYFVYLPKKVVEAMEWTVGQEFDVTYFVGDLRLKPVTRNKRA
jgi:hypothetical protein